LPDGAHFCCFEICFEICFQPDHAAYHIIPNALAIAFAVECTAIAGSVGYALCLTDISTDCTADVESLLASQATTLYDGAFMGALIGTSFPPDRMAKCHKPTVDLADQASDADSHRHAHSHAFRSSHTHPHLCAE
jgi:hypothetical protein